MFAVEEPPEKGSTALIKERRRSWPGRLRMLHIAKKIRLFDDCATEEIGVLDNGLSYSGATRLRQLEDEIRSQMSAGNWGSSILSAMIVHYCCLLIIISVNNQPVSRFIINLLV